MDGRNFPSIADLKAQYDRAELTHDVIMGFSYETLEAMQEDLANRKATLKSMKAIWKDVLKERFEAAANITFQDEKKDTGTVTMRTQVAPYVVDAKRTKRVEWDQGLLASLRERIIKAGEDASLYMKAEYKIGEAVWSNFSDQIRAAFAPARTVKPAETVYTIKRKE